MAKWAILHIPNGSIVVYGRGHGFYLDDRDIFTKTGFVLPVFTMYSEFKPSLSDIINWINLNPSIYNRSDLMHHLKIDEPNICVSELEVVEILYG